MPVLLHFIKWQLGLAPAEVWTTDAERACLARHAAGKRRLVEVGVWHGGTTRHLRGVMSPDATLYAVDPFPRGRLGISLPRVVARREVNQIQNGRVVWLRMTGAAAARMEMMREHPPVDFVFVDNAQTCETLETEWEAWAALVGPGGVIGLHDTRPWPADQPVQSSVDYARAVVLKDARFTTIEEIDSLTVLRRLPRMKVIITADDFGIDEGSNEVIVEALGRGLVTHASLLVNLGYADQACELARARGVDSAIGVHLNFSQGEPMTEAIKRSDLFCGNGEFLPVEDFPRYRRLTHEQTQLVAGEVRAQLNAAAARGITISHLDSHNDVHIAPSIARIVAGVARELRIPRVRISRNCGVRQGIVRRFQHQTYNAWLERQALRRVQYLGTIEDMIWLGRRGLFGQDVAVEIMTHPRKGAGRAMIDLPSGELLETRLKRLSPYLTPLGSAPG